MPLIPTVLASGLQAMVPTNSEPAAINLFTTAWMNYFIGASVMLVPANPGALSALKTAMSAQLIGWSQPNAAAALIAAAITSWWAQVSSLAPTIWVGTPGPVMPGAVPPPGLGGLAGIIQQTFTANMQAGLPLASAASNLANAIHSTQLGGIATVLMPTVPVPTPTPNPIL